MDNYNRDKMYEQQIQLYLEANPNPNSMKFVANLMLVKEGVNYDFPTVEDAKDVSQLAEKLFSYAFVERVFIMSNFITITKPESVEWSDIQEVLKKDICDWLVAEKPVLCLEDATENHDASSKKADAAPENTDHDGLDKVADMDFKIKTILDEYVRPAVEQDGGAITFQSFEDGVVKVALQGACSGCPSASITLKSGIESLLTSMLPEVKEVVSV